MNDDGIIRGLKCIAGLDDADWCNGCKYRNMEDACEVSIAKEVLDLWSKKQPEKITDECHIKNMKVGHCPSCGEGLNEEMYPHYCGFCGQAVLWVERK